MTLYIILTALSSFLVYILPVTSVSWVALVSAILVYKLLCVDVQPAAGYRFVAVRVGCVIVSYGSKQGVIV